MHGISHTTFGTFKELNLIDKEDMSEVWEKLNAITAKTNSDVDPDT